MIITIIHFAACWNYYGDAGAWVLMSAKKELKWTEQQTEW